MRGVCSIGGESSESPSVHMDAVSDPAACGALMDVRLGSLDYVCESLPDLGMRAQLEAAVAAVQQRKAAKALAFLTLVPVVEPGSKQIPIAEPGSEQARSSDDATAAVASASGAGQGQQVGGRVVRWLWVNSGSMCGCWRIQDPDMDSVKDPCVDGTNSGSRSG